MRSIIGVMIMLCIVACVSGESHEISMHSASAPSGRAGAAGTPAQDADPGAPASGSAGSSGVANAAGIPAQDADPGAPASGSAGSSGVANAPTAGTRESAPEPSDLADVQFSMDLDVPAGAEELKCMYVAMPADRGVIAVSSAESHYTPGSHHLLAYRSDLVGVPSGQEAIFDCGEGNWFMHNRGSYYEAQQPDSRRDLPAGVAHEFQPNEVVIIQSHYINTTDKSIAAHVTLTMHTVALATVQQEAGSILFSNNNIRIPAHSRMRVTMNCPVPQDFNPALLWSHMHKRASNFVAITDDAEAASALGTLYEEPDWSEPQPREYPSDPPVTLHAGSHVTFSCEFNNETDATIIYGDSAEKNEMCIFHGMYWPRMTAPGAESCRGGTTTTEKL